MEFIPKKLYYYGMNSEKVRLVKRCLKLKLPNKQSAFLWGARKVGKSTFLKSHFPQSLYIDLLHSENIFNYQNRPELLREEILALDTTTLKHPIIIDEIQKVPALLNEIHWLIENTDAYFILCGSSARQLKNAHVNLLGGRAWRFHMYPLTYNETPQFDLLRAFNHGLIPSHYIQEQYKRSLKSYMIDYFTQEIKHEGLVRNLIGFSRFIEALGFSHGQIINYSNIARDIGIDSKTVKEYFQILVDTMLCYILKPYKHKATREIISSSPKFYLFDLGIANYLKKETISTLSGASAGASLEHFIMMELTAFQEYCEKDIDLTYWRTKHGHEVDFVINKAQIAIEVKISKSLNTEDYKGIKVFLDEHPNARAIIVCQENKPRTIINDKNQKIEIMPWPEFLDKLWNEEII